MLASKLLFLLLASFFAFPVGGKSWRDLDLQNGCTISRIDLSESRKFPGNFCVFLPDGSFVSASNDFLRRIAPDGRQSWEKPAKIHHQLNLSPDGKRLLALSSEVREGKHGRLRFDKFLILDLDGKILAERSVTELFSERNIYPRIAPLLAPVAAFQGTDQEGSHFNSISEVPKLSGKTHPAIKEGNIVVSGLGSGVFVLTPDLKKILYHGLFPHSKDHHVHDVQVLPNGDFLYFNNEVAEKGLKIPFSRIESWDPVKNKIGISIGPKPQAYFHSPASGSVQMLSEGVLLFTHMFTGGYFAEPDGEILAAFFGGTGDPPTLIAFMHVRAWDLSSFFKNQKPQ